MLSSAPGRMPCHSVGVMRSDDDFFGLGKGKPAVKPAAAAAAAQAATDDPFALPGGKEWEAFGKDAAAAAPGAAAAKAGAAGEGRGGRGGDG